MVDNYQTNNNDGSSDNTNDINNGNNINDSNKANIPNTLSIVIKDKNVLYATYMGFVKPEGGLFIPTKKEFAPGEKLSLILSIIDEERFSITGKVNWVTPKDVHGARAPGIGVQFEGSKAKELNNNIKRLLIGFPSDRPTYTL
jgi:type IV pilus assembly protein PilZ